MKPLNYSAGTTYKLTAVLSSVDGVQIFVDDEAGTSESNTTDAQLGTNFEIGTDGNGASAGFGAFRFARIFDKALSATEIANL